MKKIEKIRSIGQQIEPPKSLEPQNIKELLGSNNKVRCSNTRKNSNRMRINSLIAVAAAIILVFTALPMHTGNVTLPVEPIKAKTYDDVYTTVTAINKNKDEMVHLDSGVVATIDKTTGITQDKPSNTNNIANSNRMQDNVSNGNVNVDITNNVNNILQGSDSNNDVINHEEAQKNEASVNKTENKEKKLDYSGTNNQVNSVQEADIVKTDGEYIYTLSKNNATASIKIVKALDGKMELFSTTDSSIVYNKAEKAITTEPFEMFVNGDRLILLNRIFENNVVSKSNGKQRDGNVVDMVDLNAQIQAVVYDITNRKNPIIVNTFSQSGNYLTSRMIGNFLYITTNAFIYTDPQKDKPETFVPQIGENGVMKSVPAACVSIMPNPSDKQFATVVGIDTKKGVRVDVKTLLGGGNSVYSSNENMYLTSYRTIKDGDYSYENTIITKFSLLGGAIELKCSGEVEGVCLNQFSMDEYNGSFRIITTKNLYFNNYDKFKNTKPPADFVWNKTSNNLFILDENLKITGKLTDLAKDEQVYSVRFIENMAYFVTFRQVDPLFAVDLSNVTKPVILSELKIPGFSEYLHPYSKNELFGFGKDTDDKGIIHGLKLSMFDITDNKAVVERYKLTLPEIYSEASYNHKAILVAPTKNMICIPADDKYLVFEYKNGFTQKAEILLDGEIGQSRGIYIENWLYIINSSGIVSYNLEKIEKIEKISF